MKIETREDAPPLPGEAELIADLKRFAVAEDAVAYAFVAVAGDGAAVRLVVHCHSDEEDSAVCDFLERRQMQDVLTDMAADEAIGSRTARQVWDDVGNSWDALYVQRSRPG